MGSKTSYKDLTLCSNYRALYTVYVKNIISLIIEVRKVLTNIAKERNCEEIQPWIRPCENHLSWSATSTFSGDGRVILAKFKSFFDHVINKHENLEDPLFNKCAHNEIETRTWLKTGELMPVAIIVL